MDDDQVRHWDVSHLALEAGIQWGDSTDVAHRHIKISSRCVVEPVEQAEARPEVDGFAREVLVRQNETVAAGQELARMENADVAQEVARADTGLKMLDRQLMILQSAGDVLEYRMKLREKSELTEKKNELDRKLTELVVTSPIRGRIATPYIEEEKGKYLQRGDVFCKVEAVDRVKIEVPFREYYVEDIQKDQRVLLRLESYPTQTFEGTVQTISPAIRNRVEAVEGTYTEFLATAVIENPESRLIPGMHGDAKILAAKYTLAGRILRELRRWIQSRVW